MPKIYLDMRAVLTQHSFHCCVDRGDEGVLLERTINLHVDVEGEIVRGWIHVQWLGLLMGPDGNSTLRGRSWVSPGG